MGLGGGGSRTFILETEGKEAWGWVVVKVQCMDVDIHFHDTLLNLGNYNSYTGEERIDHFHI